MTAPQCSWAASRREPGIAPHPHTRGEVQMTFVERMLGAAKLDSKVYEEVEADRTATPQAVGVVILASVAGGIGLGEGVRGLVFGTVAGLLGWLVWAWLIYFIGTRWLPEPGTQAD